MSIVHMSDSQFEQEVLKAKQLTLVDFWASWCGPCKMLSTILDEIDQEYEEKIKICKVNMDDNQSMAAKYQVLSIPTVLFFKDGNVISQLVGTKASTDIKKTITELL